MITRVTIEYRLPGREVERFSIECATRSEANAFDAADTRLKVELLDHARQVETSGLFFRARALAILQLRPWVHSYEYGS